MKSYTDIEQSKKLAEILPLESADMFYYKDAVTKENNPRVMNYSQVPKNKSMYYFPCWSLAALINLMPRIEHMKPFIDLSPKLNSEEVAIYYHSEDSPYIVKDNLIDACYEMIIKLHEQKLL